MGPEVKLWRRLFPPNLPWGPLILDLMFVLHMLCPKGGWSTNTEFSKTAATFFGQDVWQTASQWCWMKRALCPTVEVSLCWEQHSLQVFPHTLQSLLTLILGKRSHSFHKFKAMYLLPAKQTEPRWKRRIGQADIKVRFQCNWRSALHIYVLTS